PTCVELGLSQVVFSPLAQGLLTGKYAASGRPPRDSRAADDRVNSFLKPKLTPENLARAQRVATLARAAGHTPAQAALGWVLRRPGVASAIVGATRTEQLADNLAAGDLELSADLLAELDRVAPAPAAARP